MALSQRAYNRPRMFIRTQMKTEENYRKEGYFFRDKIEANRSEVLNGYKRWLPKESGILEAK